MNNKLLNYGLPVLVLLVIFFPLFQANYVYLDDSYQLWHNEPGSTYDIWFIHGRFLGAQLMERAFTSIHTIDAVRTYRILSVLGWALAICVYVRIATQWVRYNLIDSRLVLLSAVYLACTPSVAIANGWGGACFEIFLCFLTGLLSGHILYSQLRKHHKYLAVPIYMQLLVLVLGVASLFTYQIGIGMFLVPFFLHFIKNKYAKPDRFVITGVIAFVVITVVYYMTFKLMLNSTGEAEGHRANLNFNVLEKISFFFGVPTAQAFSFNFLFNLHSIVSQAFYIVAIAAWVANTFITQRDKPVVNKIIYIVCIIGLQMLIYLPVLVTIENYSSYRSMLSLNFAVFFLLTTMILEWIKNGSWKNRFVVSAMLVFIAVGFYNFQYNFLKPVLKEYQVMRTYIEKQYTPDITKVYFLMPPENLFAEQFHVHYYRDEFGVPSTFKDWVPMELTKQIIYEITHDKNVAKKTEVVLFPAEEVEKFNKQVALKEEHTMAIDMPTIFNSK